MRNFLTVCKFHLKEGFSSKAFILTGFFVFALIIGFFAYSHYSTDEDKITVSVLNQTDTYILDAEKWNKTYAFMNAKEIDVKDIETEQTKVKEGDLDGILVLTEIDGKPSVEYSYKSFPNTELLMVAKNDIQTQNFLRVSSENNIKTDVQQALIEEMTVQHNPLDVNESTGLVYFFSYAIFVFIMMYGQMVSMGIAGEKATRVMEIMITKVSPITMMYAKILSSLCLGLTTIAVGVCGYFVALGLKWTNGQEINLFGMPIDLSILNGTLIMYFTLYFVLGYILYTILLASFSAAVSRIEDVSMVIFPISLLLMGAFFLGFKTMMDPTNDLVIVGSYIPFFSPIVTFSRIVLGEANSGEIAATIAILISSIGILSYFANRIYMNGVMKYSNKTTFKDILQMAKK